MAPKMFYCLFFLHVWLREKNVHFNYEFLLEEKIRGKTNFNIGKQRKIVSVRLYILYILLSCNECSSVVHDVLLFLTAETEEMHSRVLWRLFFEFPY